MIAGNYDYSNRWSRLTDLDPDLMFAHLCISRNAYSSEHPPNYLFQCNCRHPPAKHTWTRMAISILWSNHPAALAVIDSFGKGAESRFGLVVLVVFCFDVHRYFLCCSEDGLMHLEHAPESNYQFQLHIYDNEYLL